MTRGLRPIDLGTVIEGEFVDRPNRFLVRWRERGGGEVHEAQMPNPGRLWELLLPGCTLYLTPAEPHENRRTRFTAVAVEREGRPVFVHTQLTNTVARFLLDLRLIPGLEGAAVVRAEAAVGHSRFDFLLREGGREFYTEVKSCTLFGGRVAMFPDAVTVRGKRHLNELAALGRAGATPAVLFLIHTPEVDWFMPDYHTDLDFSRTLLRVREEVRVLPVALDWRRDLTLGGAPRVVPMPWGFLEREAQDRGSYLLLLRLDRPERVGGLGGLGGLGFAAGWHVYVGSAMRALGKRVARHERRRKRFHWHVDYLREAAEEVVALPIRGSERLECMIAGALGELLAAGPKGFGSSDCRCATHLFFSRADPLSLPAFHAFLQRFRMKQPALT